MREGFYVGFSVYFYLIDRIFVNLDFKPAIYGGTNFFCGSLFLRIGDFWCFAGTNFCDFQKVPSAQHRIIFIFIEYVQ